MFNFVQSMRSETSNEVNRARLIGRALYLLACLTFALGYADPAQASCNGNNPPTITGVTPSEGTVQGGTRVLITGSSLGCVSVTFGGVPATDVVASADTVQATSPSGRLGSVTLTVRNPDVGVHRNATASTTFTYVASPGAPTNLLALGRDGRISVSFSPPSYTGNSAISDYEYTLDGGASWASSGARRSPINITGLTNDTRYDVALRAVNAAGVGATSGTASATPKALIASPATSTIAVSAASLPANGTSTAVITVQLIDATNTKLISSGGTVSLATSLGTLSAVTNNNDGTYSAVLTAAATPGVATITGSLNGAALQDTKTVSMTIGAASLETSTLGVSATRLSADGKGTALITVQLRDAEGLKLISSGGTVSLATSLGTLSAVTNNNDGTYSATLTASSTPGVATITGSLNGASLQDTKTIAIVDDSPPKIIGPSGSEGASSDRVSLSEGQTLVARLQANEAVTWSISGGTDAARFQIAPNGALSFLVSADFENPADEDRNNVYSLIVAARDGAGNVSSQSLLVSVIDVDDTAPLIQGPSGSPGSSVSAIILNEGALNVTAFSANEAVTWSLDGGSDAARFSINASTGALIFLVSPDYENPTDSDRNNVYVVNVKALDARGNRSDQLLSVTIANVDEISRALNKIGDRLRSGLRSYATQSLSDMLSFNESLARDGSHEASCDAGPVKRDLQGALNANETGGNLDLRYAKRLSQCGRAGQVMINGGLSSSKLGASWNTRLFADVRYEAQIKPNLTLGLSAMASTSRDQIQDFGDSSISDETLQLNLYGRYRIHDKLKAGVFWGLGRSWYDFALREAEGLSLTGRMTGNRQVYGWMLSGDYMLGHLALTTDAIISRATEKLGSAQIGAQYLGEKRSGIAFDLGKVDVTRISVPISAPIRLTGHESWPGAASQLLLSSGILCEDNDVVSSVLRCGYQLGAKLTAKSGTGRNSYFADYRWESVAGIRRSLVGLGFVHHLGGPSGLALAIEAHREMSELMGPGSRAMASLRIAR